MSYQGHKNWNHWNVSLHLNNDHGLYRVMRDAIHDSVNQEEAAQLVLEWLAANLITHTPDGAPYTKTSIKVAMRGL